MGGQHHAVATLPLGQSPNKCYRGGWMDPRASLGFKPPIILPLSKSLY